jgi:hypothetical protein
VRPFAWLGVLAVVWLVADLLVGGTLIAPFFG